MTKLHRNSRLVVVGLTLLVWIAALWNALVWNPRLEAALLDNATAESVVRNIEGWTVVIDAALLSDEHCEQGEESLKALANHLQRVRYVVPADRVKQLQQLPIRIDWMHELTNLQYHPSREWLEQNGYDPGLEKHIHVPRAGQLLDSAQWAKHPYAILHELAHAFHDQCLGFDHTEIELAYQQAKSSGAYDSVLLHTGERGKHYAMSNAKEYFAESTEAYFGVNDFFPFVRAELQEHDPRMFELMQRIWGEIR